MSISIPHIAISAHSTARELAVRADRLVARQRRSYSPRRAEQIAELQAQYRALNAVAISHGAL